MSLAQTLVESKIKLSLDGAEAVPILGHSGDAEKIILASYIAAFFVVVDVFLLA
jgi:hypothetical protein